MSIDPKELCKHESEKRKELREVEYRRLMEEAQKEFNEATARARAKKVKKTGD